MSAKQLPRAALAAIIAALLAACGGSSSGSSSGTTFDLSVFVTGLEGSDSVVLQNDGGDDLAIDANGDSTFATEVAEGDEYAVTLLSTSTEPRLDCVIADGEGTMTDDVTVNVQCGVAYHLLLGEWGLEAEPDSGAFSVGVLQPDVAIAERGDNDLVLRDVCRSRSRLITVAGDNGKDSTVRGEGECEVGYQGFEATFGAGQVTLDFPESSDDGLTEEAWDIGFARIGTGETRDMPDFASGTSIVESVGESGELAALRYVHGLMARESDDAAIADLLGDWGIVRLEIGLEELADDGERDPEALYSSAAVPARFEIGEDGDGQMVIPGQDIASGKFLHTETELIHFADGSPTEKRFFNQYEEGVELPLEVDPRGQLRIISDGLEGGSGFVTPDANLLVWADNNPAPGDLRADGADEIEEVAVHQWLFAVRRDDEPDLQGREYAVSGPMVFVTGGRFELTPWGPDGALAFHAENSTVTITFDDAINSIVFANEGGNGIEQDGDDPEEFEDVSYWIGTSEDDKPGLIEIDIATEFDEDNAFLTGFAQEGGELLVMQFGFAEDVGDSGEEYKGQIGLLFATCTNCE